jgi:hypothetical protein
MTEDYVFYILMRTDLASLNPGKAMAQASHAFGALKRAVKTKLFMQKAYIAWQNQTEQDFGATIVLGASESGINNVLDLADRFYPRTVKGWVHDPSYPLRDGSITHLIPLNTCAFVFGERSDLKELLGTLELHP